MSVCMCVSVYDGLYVCMYVCKYVCMYIRMYACMCVTTRMCILSDGLVCGIPLVTRVVKLSFALIVLLPF